MPKPDAFVNYLIAYQERIALCNPIKIRMHSQVDFQNSISEGKFSREINQSSLKASPGGYCIALVSEWLRYSQTQRDFFEILTSPSLHDVQRILFLQDHMNSRFDNLLKKNLNAATLFGYISRDATAKCFVNVNDGHHLTKMYGWERMRACLQWNRDNIATLTSHAFLEENSGQSRLVNAIETDDFSLLIEEEIQDMPVGCHKQILYQAHNENRVIVAGHCMGITAVRSPDNQIHYLFYDPSIGEITFSNLNDCRNILKLEMSDSVRRSKLPSFILMINTYDARIKYQSLCRP